MSTENLKIFILMPAAWIMYACRMPWKDLVKRMTEADQVSISGPGTDLRFSIKGIKAIGCSGTHNIPDGEVFSAPSKTVCRAMSPTMLTPFIREPLFRDKIIFSGR